MTGNWPNIDEIALGAFLHDIGKLAQRALTEDKLPQWILNNESELLPLDKSGQKYTHRHVLFTEHFFAALKNPSLLGMSVGRVRDAAVYHHKPRDDQPWTWLVAEADRLASGMERKEKDVEHEAGALRQGRDFRTTPLVALQTRIQLVPRQKQQTLYYAPQVLQAQALIPAEPGTEAMRQGYEELWKIFFEGFHSIAQNNFTSEHLHQAVLSLSERLLWSVPSSTMDEPDVSLHDHSLAVAAIAVCLFHFHAHDDSLDQLPSIRDRKRPKFRLLEGDLSGIQDTLFRLERQQVRGVNRILRGRSFRLQAIAEAATLCVREQLRLPPYNVLLRAGGRFTLLVPNTPQVEQAIERLQGEFDRWLRDAYSGELALILTLSDPLSGEDLMRENWRTTWRRFVERRDGRKLRPLASVMQEPRLEVDYPAQGTCAACGLRPRPADGERCDSCAAEFALGQTLPSARAIFWRRVDGEPDGRRPGQALFGNILVEAKSELPKRLRESEVAGYALGFGDSAPETGLPWRLLANHVPTWEKQEWDDPRFKAAIEKVEDIDRLEEGALVTMQHLAHVDCEQVNGRLVGRPMLAVLKADVDDLGQIFGRGLGKDQSIARTLALSRLLDAFFSGWLPECMRKDPRFRWIYTVYAGGDDLLLIGPWRTMLDFAVALSSGFTQFAGNNPDLHLSAGIEFVTPDEPLNRSVQRAEERLEQAKSQGKNRVSLIVDQPLTWEQLEKAIKSAAKLSDLLRAHELSTSFLHHLLVLDDHKQRAESGGSLDLTAATWKARLHYMLARHFADPTTRDFFQTLIGPPGMAPPVPARVPISIALWRNREGGR